MANSYRHFYIQDLVDQALDEVLGWIGKANIGPITAETTQAIDTALKNISPSELRVDSAHLVQHGERKHVVVVETQLSRDNKKMFAISRYNATFAAMYECPSMVLMLTPKRNIARWAKRHAQRFHSPWGQIHVIGPEDVPTDFPGFETDKQRNIAFLRAALTHDVALLNAILEHLQRQSRTDAVEPDTMKQYIITLERIAPTDWWQRITEADMEWVSTVEKYERRGIQQGLKQGREEGLERGLETARRIFRKFLNVHGLALTHASNQQLDACKDLAQIEAWTEWLLAYTGEETEVDLPA